MLIIDDIANNNHKVHNARTGKEVKRYNEYNTSRFSKKGSTVQFRTDLKTQTNKAAKEVVEKIRYLHGIRIYTHRTAARCPCLSNKGFVPLLSRPLGMDHPGSGNGRSHIAESR